MSAEPASLAVPARALRAMIAWSLAIATLIVVCFVLPAEFRIDPTGIGKLTGVIRLAGPKRVTAQELEGSGAPAANGGAPVAAGAASGGAAAAAGGSGARYYDGGYRSDFVDIPLTVAGSPEQREELEYKVHMKAGATLTYSWTASGLTNPEELYFDFHGEAPATKQGEEGTVVEYRQATGAQSHGTLVAPFDGVFGWYLQNQSEKPLVVHLKISGFYTLVPPGEYGNEAGIEANKAR